MVYSGGYKDKQISQSSFDEYLFTGLYEDTGWIADVPIGPGPNQESSEFFYSSWINEGSQAAGRVESSEFFNPSWINEGSRAAGRVESSEFFNSSWINEGSRAAGRVESSEFFNSSWINEGSRAAGRVDACLYEDTELIADLPIGPGPNRESSEFFNSSWINEGSQAAGRVEAWMAQGLYGTASGIQPQQNQTATGIQTLTQQPLSQPGDMSTHSRKNIPEPSDANQKRLEKKRGHDKAYRERVKQKRQKLEVENQEKDEQMKAFEAEIGRLNAEIAEIQGHEKLMKGEIESLKEENLLLNQRLQTKSRELDQLQNKVKYPEQLIKRLKKFAKEMEDMRVQTAATEAAIEEEKNELQSFNKQSDQFLISKMIIRAKVEHAFQFLDALFTEAPNNESDSDQPTPHFGI